MKTIYKYVVPSRAENLTIEMKEEAKILCVQMQKDDICIWAEIDTEAHSWDRHFRIIVTGEGFPAGIALVYIGTFQKDWFVGHLYEEIV
jgi:hypothetical protein